MFTPGREHAAIWTFSSVRLVRMMANDGSAGVLAALGVSDAEEVLYRNLLRRGGGSVSDMFEATALSQRKARQAMASLEDKGLITRSLSRPNVYIAAPPDAAVEILALRRQEELERARLAGRELMKEMGVDAPPAAQREVVELVAGGVPSQSLNHQVMVGARSEILALTVPPLETPDDSYTEMKIRILRRGVHARVVYSPESLEHPGVVQFVEAVRAAGEEPRVASPLLTYLLIVDRRIAYLPVQSESGGHNGHDHLLVHPSSLLDALVVMFESVWERATPFEPGLRPVERTTPSDAGPLSPEESRVLALLGAGMQDASIGVQLGMGYRTVQRHVRQIMDALGTKTRFQTGLEAHRRGWLGGPCAEHQSAS